jgi:hypothetical protein
MFGIDPYSVETKPQLNGLLTRPGDTVSGPRILAESRRAVSELRRDGFVRSNDRVPQEN